MLPIVGTHATCGSLTRRRRSSAIVFMTSMWRSYEHDRNRTSTRKRKRRKGREQNRVMMCHAHAVRTSPTCTPKFDFFCDLCVFRAFALGFGFRSPQIEKLARTAHSVDALQQ